MKKQAVLVIIAGFCCIFVSFAVRYAYGLLLPYMIPALGVTKAQAGTIYSSYFMAYMVFSPILGILIDRFDAKVLLTVFIGLLGIGTFLMAFATTLSQACLFFGLAGLGQSAGWVPVVTLVQRWVSERRRATAIAIVDLGSGSGIILVSLILPLLISAFHWQGAWIGLGVAGMVVALLNFFLVSNPPDPSARSSKRVKGSDAPPLLQAYRMIVGSVVFWLIGFAYMAISFAILIPFAFLPTYAVQVLSIAYPTAASLIGILALSGITGKLSLGHLSDKVGRVRIMLICGLLTCMGTLGMAFADTYFMLVMCTIVFGIGYGALWPVYAAASRDFFNHQYAGRVMGLWTLFLGIGSIISPVLTGWIIDISGHFNWAFVLSSGASVVSVLVLIPALRIPYMKS